MILHSSVQVAVVIVASVLLWAGILIPEEHHAKLVHILCEVGAIVAVLAFAL
ncbi:MAG TPA: hypothetical protein VIV60_04790 [Polyangiaceae bacterium]